MDGFFRVDEALFRPASVVGVLVRRPGENQVAGSIPDRGRHPGWAGNFFTAMDVKPWAPGVEISAHIKEPSGGRKVSASYSAESLT